MLPTNVMSFMKKMVSNTEAMNANQFIGGGGGATQSSTGGTGGAIGRLRQTLQQAQETVSNRLTQTRTGYLPGQTGTDQQANEQGTGDSQQNVQPTPTINCTEEKENQEAARPGDAGRCRVCVKAMKPDEYFKECTECSLRVCDDCASYSNNADGNEVAWRCSVCRRRGVAIIARRVQPGIEQSEVLEGLGCETTIRKSPDARRLQNSGRADSETEVLLLAPKPSDVRRHSDVPLRDIAKFQASVSAAASQHNLGLTVAMPGEKAKSSNDIIQQGNKEDGTPTSGGGGPNISISVTVPTSGKSPGDKTPVKDSKAPVKPSGKGAPMKRQRSYERGASEGALNLPANVRGRRASCDMRGMDASSILNNNTIQPRDKSAERASAVGIPGLSEKDLQRLQFQHQQNLQQQQRDQQPKPQGQSQSHPNQQQQQQHRPQAPPQQQYQQQSYQQQQPPPQQYQPQGQPQQQYQGQQGQTQYQQQSTQQYQQGQQYQQQSYQQVQAQGQGGQQHQVQQYQQTPQQYQQYQQQPYQQVQGQGQPQQQQYQQSPQQQQQIMGRGKAPPSDLAIGNDLRRRSVQIYNTTTKQAPTPRSCASLDTEGLQERNKLQQQQNVTANDSVKRQGSSTDGEAIKIVIDDVDSTAAKTRTDNNHMHKGQSGIQGPGGEQSGDFRTRVIRLRRDPQDRGYQTRGYGLRVVGGCSSPGNPGNLRARVARVTPGSGADFAGIRRGDIVLAWNGVKLSNMTFEEVCKVLDTSGDTVELNIASLESDAINVSTVPENEPVTQDWEQESVQPEPESLSVSQGADQYSATSPTTGRRHLPRLPTEGRIQLRLFHDEVHNTLEISVANIAFGNDDCTTIDLNDIIITLRIGDKIANTRWNQCVLFTKVSPEDLFDSWLILELVRGPDFLGESHVDMGRVSLDDRPVWFPFSAKGSSSHRGSISQIVSPGGNTPPSARELARRLRMRMAGSQSQSEEQDDSSGQSSPCATSLLRPEVAWEMLGTLGPPSTNLTSRSAPTSRRGSAQSDRGAMGMDGMDEGGRGSAPSTPALPRSLPPSRRGSFAFAVEQVISQSRRSSVAFQQRVPDMFMRQLPEIPDGGGIDPAMLRNRRNSAWNPREIGFDRRGQFERTDSLRAMANQQRRTSEATQSFRDVVFEARQRLQMQPKRPDVDEWRQQQWAPQ